MAKKKAPARRKAPARKKAPARRKAPARKKAPAKRQARGRASSRRPDLLPPPAELRARWSALALLHHLLEAEELAHPDDDEGDARTFDFQPAWAEGEEAGTFDDQSGDRMFAVFTPGGVYLQGFSHESPMTPWAHDPPRAWPGLFDGLPAALARHVDEPAFQARVETTFLLWWDAAAPGWRTGVTRWHPRSDPDGSEALLGQVLGDAKAVRRRLEDEYERDVPEAAVQAVLDHAPLTPALVKALRADVPATIAAAWAAKLGHGR